MKEIRDLLELGPPANEARALLLAVETGLARETLQAPTAISTPVLNERADPAELELAFQSTLDDGVLTIYAGSEQLLRARFKDLDPARVNPLLQARHSLAPGKTTFRAYTTIRRLPAQMATLEADVRDGARLRLSVRQGDTGPPTVALDPISTN